jgi:sugar lactone lactonase YvrE
VTYRFNGSLRAAAFALVAASAMLAVTSCSGGGSSGVPLAKPGSASTASVTVIIHWPTAAVSTSSRRRPSYLSPSTKSVSIVVNGSSTTIANNPAFTGTPASTTVLNVDAPVGPDTFLVTSFDQLSAAGNILGQVSVPFSVVLDVANTLSVTLNGNLAKIACEAIAPFVTGTTAMTLVGPAGQVALLPEDADGNVIVAPGTIPTLALAPAMAPQATITSTSTPNEFNVNLLVSGVAVTLNGTGSDLNGDPISTTCNITRVPALYVANHSAGGTSPSITIYPASATSASTPTATLSGSNTELTQVQFLAVDPKGNLFVTNQGPLPSATFGPNAGFVSIYSPATGQVGNQAPVATIPNINTPEGIAFDSSNALHVLSIDRVTTYPSSADGVTAPAAASSTIAGSNTDLFSCYGMFVDTTGIVYTACSNVLNIFAAGASGNATPAEVEALGATSMSFSSQSWLGVAADSSGNFYAPASNNNLNLVDEYTAGSGANPASTPVPTISKGVSYSQPIGIWVDSANNIYVANYGSSTVDVFNSSAAFVAGLPTNTVSSGINAPYGVTVR